MRPDVLALKDFYRSPLGASVQSLIHQRLRATIKAHAGERLLCIGYGLPFLDPFMQDFERIVTLMPARQGAVFWPETGKCLSLLGDETHIPFDDAVFDRVIVIHALEFLDHVRGLLREIWRIMAPGAKAHIITPNRSGLWARMEHTPFGNGRPFSRRQLNNLLNECLLSTRSWETSLTLPPLSFLRWLMPISDRLGQQFWPRLGGVHIVEAEKVIYAARPLKEHRSRHRGFVPASQPVQAREIKKTA